VNNSNWISYNELAWVDPILAPPEDCVEETEYLCRLIREQSRIEPKTLLHLGSGAGINDYTFKKYFQVTGVDISDGMLEVARQINPEVQYHKGDMRTANLGETFDAVTCTEAIGYMLTLEDTRQAVSTAYKHLKPGGVFLFTALVKEDFRENNFVYTGTKGNIEITVFENNYRSDPESSVYEATMIYLIRRRGELEVYTDSHLGSLFSLEDWTGLLKEFNFELREDVMTDNYKPYLMSEGSYPIQVFACTRPGPAV